METVLEAASKAGADVDVQDGSGLARILDWASTGSERMVWSDLYPVLKSSEQRRALVQHEMQIGDILRKMR
jgi:hypothetical protein